MKEATTTNSMRPTRKADPQELLFDVDPDWRQDWWGMPAFDMDDARPSYKLTVNFLTAEDVAAFAKATGLPITTRSDTTWFPRQEQLKPGKFYYDGPPTDSRYPVCIPSKGRARIQKTGTLLARMGVTHRFFVEETEYDEYCAAVGESRVVRMPFHDLGQGSIPARNFIWEWAKERGYARHWVVDDNIRAFRRTTNNARIRVFGGGYFRAMEDYVDRFDNVALAGPHSVTFVNDREPDAAPFLLNSRVYSCILVDTALPYRWRGRYNEDTDLSLRVLKDGYATLLFRAFCMCKENTASSKGRPTPGGNTDNVYNEGDHRLAFANSLKEQHPDVVSVTWKFNRWHHHVDYSPFRRNRPRLRPGVVPTKATNDYGMKLVRGAEVADGDAEPVAAAAPAPDGGGRAAPSRFKPDSPERVPTDLREMYAAKGRTIAEAKSRGPIGKVGEEWRLTSETGKVVTWTRQDSISEPWRARLHGVKRGG